MARGTKGGDKIGGWLAHEGRSFLFLARLLVSPDGEAPWAFIISLRRPTLALI